MIGALAVTAACATPDSAKRPVEKTTAVEVREPEPPPESDGLYAVAAALEDALSGRLRHLGTGRWPGIERSSACAFRNDRVVVVLAYCTVTETPAFRVDVYSPEHGRVRLYAEARGPLSTRRRADYFTFTAASEPPPPPEGSVGSLSLGMSYDELRRYERRRYDAYLPTCYGGTEHGEKVGGCLGDLAARADAWTASNGTFLEHASNDWYRLVRELRAMAMRHGRDPD
ncbi:MAG: hypothetical protein PVI30_03995 [Myxococcales bacterium]